MQENGVEENELIAAKNSIKSSFIYPMQSLEYVTNQLNQYNFYLDEPNSFLYDLERFQKLTTADIKSAAQKYLNDPFIQLNVIPKNKG